MERTAANTRKSGEEVLAERFPDARWLWVLDHDVEQLGFKLSGILVDGRVVILQQFTDHRAGSWDVYVPATDSGRIDETLDAIALPAACRTKQCTYYQHYLAYGPAELVHEGFHAAEVRCAEWQQRLEKYFDAHPNRVNGPEYLEEECRRWEARIRA